MNEARHAPADSGGSAVRMRDEDRPRRTRHGFLSACREMVHHANRKIDTTEIRWNYELEVYECVKCHSIMYYDYSFKVCPFCERKIKRYSDGKQG